MEKLANLAVPLVTNITLALLGATLLHDEHEGGGCAAPSKSAKTTWTPTAGKVIAQNHIKTR